MPLSDRWFKSTAHGLRSARLILASDYMAVLLLVLSVQGTVILSQTLMTLLVGPVEIGRIRTFESAFTMFLLFAGFGAPALAVRDLAVNNPEAERGRVFRDLALMPAVGAVIGAILIQVLAALGLSKAVDLGRSTWLVPVLLLLVNMVRVMAGAMQGLLIVRSALFGVLAGAGASAALQLAGGLRGGLEGWVVGRVFGETAFLGAILIHMRGRLPLSGWLLPLDILGFAQSFRSAITVNSGLILRSVADGAPILLMSFVGTSTGAAEGGGALKLQIGEVGIATLVLTCAMLPLSVVSQRELPLIAMSMGKEQVAAIRRIKRRAMVTGLCVAVPAIAVIVALHVFGLRPAGGSLLPAATLLLAVPFRAAAAARGGILTARGRFGVIALINSIELAAIVVSIISMIAYLSAQVAVFGSLIGSGVSLGLFVYFEQQGEKRSATD